MIRYSFTPSVKNYQTNLILNLILANFCHNCWSLGTIAILKLYFSNLNESFLWLIKIPANDRTLKLLVLEKSLCLSNMICLFIPLTSGSIINNISFVVDTFWKVIKEYVIVDRRVSTDEWIVDTCDY